MTLLEKQQGFSRAVVKLLTFIHSQGYEVTLGEAWRSDETAKLDASEGKGIVNSVHRERLAIDLCLFKGAIYLQRTNDYAFAGSYWKSLSTEECVTCWGGDFSKPDGNHFSVENLGIK